MPVIRTAALAIAAALCAAPLPAAEVHVSPGGSDAAAGSAAEPFASLERARDAVRALRRADPASGALVVVHAGTYELARPLALSAEDSGSAAAPVTWSAESGAEVRLVGGRMVDGFRPVDDAETRERLDPSARSHVVFVDLGERGIDDFGDMSGGFGMGGSTGMELFVNDVPMTVARYPNEGFMRITRVLGSTVQDVRGTRGCTEGIFEYEGDRPARWTAERDARVLGYWFWDWADQRHAVQHLDPEARTITVAQPYHGYGYRAGQWFYAYNLLCEIDRPGEWYLDRRAGIAYVWPPEPIARATFTILPAVVEMTGVSHVTFRGLTIEGARGHGVVMKNCTSCAVVGCTVRNVGSWAVRVDEGRGCSVAGCDVSGSGDGGISLSGGDRRTLAPGGHVADNNHVHHYSRWNRTYRPGVSINGVGNRMTHNLVDHAPHQAVGFGGNDHLIEFNEIHNVCEESNDAGVMYAWNDWAGRGHVVRHNYVHHVYGRDARGCKGVYLDDNFSCAEITGNIFYWVTEAVHIGGGRDSAITNNVFVECWPAIHIDARGLGWRAYGRDELVKKLEQWPFRTEPWCSRYPKLLTLVDDEPMTPKGTTVARNICWNGSWDDIEGKARPYVSLDGNLVDVDPKFQNLARGDFRLRNDSPALRAGFVRIPVEKIGLYPDAARASWPVAHTVDVMELKKRTGPAGLEKKPHPGAPGRVPRSERPPTIDGAIAEGEWPAAAETLAESPDRTPVTGTPCAARFAHDGRRLYVAVEVTVADPRRLAPSAGWGASDAVEICFGLQGDAKPGPTFVLHGFSDGKTEMSLDAGAPADVSRRLVRDTRFAARAGTDRWVAEWSVPLASAGIAVRPGLVLGLNVGVRRMETDEWIVWAGAVGPTWNLANSRRVVFE